jgi:malonate-semialdehyde dehydrogenase (acetylating) / methylmalonate-semialdehyde dehydrogenase
MFIDGKFVESKTSEWIDLFDPATNKVVTKVPKCTQDEMLRAVESSKKAYKVSQEEASDRKIENRMIFFFFSQTWKDTSILTRQQVMFKYQHIIRSNMAELAKNITQEQGKTLIDAEGDVLRGLRE